MESLKYMIDLTQYEELTKVYKQAQKLERECEKQVNKAKLINFEKAMQDYDKMYEPYIKFRDTVLAQTIFNFLLKLNPVLIEHRTGKKLKFVEVFGRDFSKLTQSMVLHVIMLVRESSIIYKFQDDIKMLNERIIKNGDYEKLCQIGFETPIWRNGEEIDGGYQYGIPSNEWLKLSYDGKVKNDNKFESMSERERAEYMNKNYGMKYKLKNYSDEKPQEK